MASSETVRGKKRAREGGADGDRSAAKAKDSALTTAGGDQTRVMKKPRPSQEARAVEEGGRAKKRTMKEVESEGSADARTPEGTPGASAGPPRESFTIIRPKGPPLWKIKEQEARQRRKLDKDTPGK